MKTYEFNEIIKENTVMALGYFDAIHIGHKALLKRAVELSKKYNATATALIFTGSFKGNGEVFTFNERLNRIENSNVSSVVYANLNEKFLSLSASEFTAKLFSAINVKALVCGEDFTYGKNASGNVETLLLACKQNGVELSVVNKVTDSNGNKISTFDIKKLIQNGKVKTANSLLGDNYFISGEVVKGKQLGNTIGFPTANIKLNGEKTQIKRGVYKTFVVINGVKYPSITNVGAQPTVSGNEEIIETYIDGFSGNLYGENLTVYFVDFIREIKKFNSLNELTNQLLKDKRSLYD